MKTYYNIIRFKAWTKSGIRIQPVSWTTKRGKREGKRGKRKEKEGMRKEKEGKGKKRGYKSIEKCHLSGI